MDKEKEIEQTAKALHGALVYDGGYGWDDEQEVDCWETARILVNAGYGNVKQAVKEFAKELKKCFLPMSFGYMCLDVWESINNLFKELYGEE